jgi:imidazolonepropionase-like amidohydrolase
MLERTRLALIGCAAAAILGLGTLRAQEPPAYHGTRPSSLALRNVMVIKGDGSPPYGPTTVSVRDGRIVAERVDAPALELDGAGCWLHPGFVNTHGHLQSTSGGLPIPAEYILKLWLACGITAVRENGSEYSRTARLRTRSRSGEIAAPRIYIYRGFGAVATSEEAQARVRSFKESGADGIKLWSNASYDPDLLSAILTEARNVGLRTTAHIGVGESNATHYSDFGVTSIEHWYGIPDAALAGVQQFPARFSYSNEVDRFRWAGRLWREVDPEKLQGVLARMVHNGVSWSPTLAVYEASRDLVRAENQPWFKDYLHPGYARAFLPSLETHGSYFIGWTSADEAYWRENYRIWMDAVRAFARRGGNVTTGEDAGYIYLLHGFGLIRELELHLEAGFHPLEVIRHATYNGAKVLGEEMSFGRVRNGLAADLVVVHGNPLENLKVYYPGGTSVYRDGKPEQSEGVRWTIKDGYVYHAPTLLAEVRGIVSEARAKAQGAQGGAK